MDTIELFIEDFDQDGIKAISFVNDPAIEENWVALNKHEIKFKSIDDDKRIVIGIALKPDFSIPRVKGDYKFNVIFFEHYSIYQYADIFDPTIAFLGCSSYNNIFD